MRNLDPQEIEKLAALRRVKIVATAALAGCFLAMVLAKLLEARFPALGVLAAFTEAATIGGIADWYAVVALFKRPLNLPFPHTAIIPSNQHRIGENIGRFIESNFLADEPVEARLRDIDFAGEIAHWLSDRNRASSLAGFTIRFVPQVLASVDEKGLVEFATQSVATQLKRTNITPLVGDVIDALATERTHNRLINDLINALHEFLNDEETLEAIRLKVNAELPTLLKFVPADTLIMRRIVHALTQLTEEVRADRQHPLRAEFETFLVDYVKRMKSSRTFATRVEQMKRTILERPELNDIAQKIWSGISHYIQTDVASDRSVLADRLADLFVDIGTRLEGEPALRRDINAGMVMALKGLVAENRGEIAVFVADQVKSWDFEQLSLLIEANVGRDLQFIRFNGMLVGGMVGVVLYLLETLFL